MDAEEALRIVHAFWGDGTIEEWVEATKQLQTTEKNRTTEEKAADQAATERFFDAIEARLNNSGVGNEVTWQRKYEDAVKTTVRLTKERDDALAALKTAQAEIERFMFCRMSVSAMSDFLSALITDIFDASTYEEACVAANTVRQFVREEKSSGGS